MEGPVWIKCMGTSPEGIQNNFQIVYTLSSTDTAGKGGTCDVHIALLNALSA